MHQQSECFGFVKGIAYLNYFEKFNNNKAWLDSAKKYIPDNSVADVTQNLKALVRWAYLKNDFVKVIDYSQAGAEYFQRAQQNFLRQ